MSVTHIPQQSIPSSEKDVKWRRNTVEAYITQANFQTGSNSYRYWLMKLYDYYNGKIDRQDYSYVLEPYGKSRDNFPAKIRNFPIIKPVIDLLVGEKAKRPFNFTVVVSDGDVETVKMKAKQKEVNENLQQWLIKKLNDAGFDTGIESQEEIDLPGDVERVFERNWRDNRAIMAQKALRFLIPYVQYHDKVQKAWFDFLVSGYGFTERGVRNNEPFYRVLNPLNIDYDKDPEIDYIEDGNWAVNREIVSRSSAIDKFRKKLTDEQVERLENPRNTNSDVFFWYNERENTFYDDWDDYTELVTVYWKSLKKIKFRTYVDEFGEVLEEVVDEDYQYNPETDVALEDDWINEVWQGYRLDGDIYLDIKPVVHQRASIDNPSKCKLPINGRIYSNRNSENISLVELGVPYQLSYNIFKYRLENAIAKSKDILALLNIEMIPQGWSMDKFMHILEATGIGWVDYSKEGHVFNPQHQSVIDMSIKTIEQYIALLQFVREEWEYVSGISRQRMGSTSPYELKSTTEQAIVQSSHITEDYFRKFAGLEQRDLQALIDYSQIAWINGKKASYVTPEGYPQYLSIDPDTYTHAEFGVFVKDANKEADKIEQMKALAQPAVQNGAPLSMITEMIDSENFAEMKDKIKEVEQLNAQMQEQAQKMEQQIRERELLEQRLEREHESIENEKDRQNKIDLKLIEYDINQAEDDDWKKQLEQRKLELEKQIKNRELKEEERSNKAEERLKAKEITAKKQSTSQ